MHIMQTEALIVTLMTFVFSLMLAVYLTKDYLKKKRSSTLLWSSGLWIFAISVFLEILFSLNISSGTLMGPYLFLVALLVELLALGSMQLVKSPKLRYVYYAFAAITTLFLIYAVAVSDNSGLVQNYVVSGTPSMLVIDSSSIVVFPATIVLIAVSLMSYLRKRDKRMLSIILGVIIVGVAGTLYIASFPSLLYIAEFVGVLFLWMGFYRNKE